MGMKFHSREYSICVGFFFALFWLHKHIGWNKKHQAIIRCEANNENEMWQEPTVRSETENILFLCLSYAAFAKVNA